ncbi:S41 family peptidase [Aquimarina algiphila]|uniref:S41 family peptidase n=1 Tax=Aquimarina algiphila TaxID=2047982 RepID=UPI0024930C54|nr:S41 family peptidase [Aquimarina algiphila]
MKSIFKGILFSLLLITNVYGQDKPKTIKDSIAFFYNDLLSNLESKYLNRKEIDWDNIKAYTLKNAFEAKDFETSLKTTTKLFDTIGCNHCELFAEKDSYKSTLNTPLSQDDFSIEFLRALENETGFNFDVKLINKNIGYINMPGMLLINLSQDSLNLKTQKMYDKIVELKKKETIKGWVIDLRFNIGGNAYVMLAALYNLLGDNIVYNSVDINGAKINTNRLENGGFYSGKTLKTKVNISTPPDLQIPVALIIGKMTGSAGEDIAVAFKNRKNVIFIGEKSYGFLTGNDVFELPFNTKIALTMSYIVDVNNKYREYIIPDIEVIKKDNFKDLAKDEKIIRAIAFFETVKE